MNNTIRNKIRSSDTYTKIYYQTKYSHGEMILKDELLNSKPSFHKLFKDSKYEVIRNYRVTMLDIVKSALYQMKSKRYTFITRLKSEFTRTYPNSENIFRFKEQIRMLNLRIDYLERKLAI